MIAFTLNGKPVQVDVPRQMPLLWVLRTRSPDRHEVRMRRRAVRACTVHVGGEATRSCLTTWGGGGEVGHHHRGVGKGKLHVLQEAWLAEDVAQCGYCQPGQIMSAAALLASKPHPTDAEIDDALSGTCAGAAATRASRGRQAGGGVSDDRHPQAVPEGRRSGRRRAARRDLRPSTGARRCRRGRGPFAPSAFLRIDKDGSPSSARRSRWVRAS